MNMSQHFVERLQKFVKNYNLHVFHLHEAVKQEIYVNSQYIYGLESVINRNFVLVIIAENCFVIPRLCALRWKYFEAIINRHNKKFKKVNGAIVIDITDMMIDSGVLETIRFVKFGNTFLRFLYENNGYNLFCEKEETDAWKKFLDLLIPPKDYWKSKYSFDFGEPDNTSTNQNQTVPINIEQHAGLPTDFHQ